MLKLPQFVTSNYSPRERNYARVLLSLTTTTRSVGRLSDLCDRRCTQQLGRRHKQSSKLFLIENNCANFGRIVFPLNLTGPMLVQLEQLTMCLIL